MKDTLTAMIGELEVTTYDDEHKVFNRRPFVIGVLEAKIPQEVAAWLMANARPKEGGG